ncbi:capsular polysaccharide transport system permease protein [Paraburkholderia sp. JPY158]|uniref:Capsular polysaccharide transport system permease protein n=1 Tax=Paraburkholderia atlantica TaxID=2654982 RepID=A0A7W8Q1C4_PARAM|nr:hypothetical protein [Paraburkholderia atlantica]MBB5421879.1 capsular polysaccharide transport system permease protein [Paraburkholderia atlantica]
MEKIEFLPVQPSQNKGISQLVKQLRSINRLLFWTVLVPTLVATVYYGLIASDVYVSESRFVVRSPQKQSPTNLLGSLLQGSSVSTSATEAYPVRDYALSRDALQSLDADHLVSTAYGKRGADFLSRFPRLDFDRSFEAFYRYYQDQVGIDLDPNSGITILTVRAFTAADAVKINERLINLSEALVNRLNQRARHDSLRFAQAEVDRSEAKAKEAALALSGYRSQQSVFDPDQQSALQLQQVSKLQDRLIEAQTQLAQLQSISPQNSQVSALRSTIQSLHQAIDKAAANVTGAHGSLSNKAAEFERLTLDLAFANKQLASSLDFLETTRSEAGRKQLYLERLVQPNSPDVAIEPHRLRSILTVLVCGLIAWGILTLLLAGVREHHD